jgi:5-methylcytosine-specific restriction endonuclease McrBC regulatory subunit McrC
LAVVNPESKEVFVYANDEFELYTPVNKEVKITSNLLAEIESTHENLPVYLIQD